MKLFDAAYKTLMRTMDVRMIRQSMLNNNIANADTPNYVPQEVDFNGAMKAAMPKEDETLNGTNDLHIMEAPDSTDLFFEFDGGYGEIPTYFDRSAEPGVDGNQVDIDTTMSHLAQNALNYNAAARSVAKKLSILKYVVTDGRG